jgi:hypothetical protein
VPTALTWCCMFCCAARPRIPPSSRSGAGWLVCPQHEREHHYNHSTMPPGVLLPGRQGDTAL